MNFLAFMLGRQLLHLLITVYSDVVDAILFDNWVARPLSSWHLSMRTQYFGIRTPLLSMPYNLNLSIYRCRSASVN